MGVNIFGGSDSAFLNSSYSLPFWLLYFTDVFEDAVLSWRLLRTGGILIFDDYDWLRAEIFDRAEVPKVAIDAFVQVFRKDFELIHNGRQLILRKVR